MDIYWIVRKDGVVIASLAERFYEGIPELLLEDLKEMAHSGPIEWIASTGFIRIGDSLEA